MPETSSPKPALWPDMSQRADLPELMDAEGVDRETLWQTLRELEKINTWLGGYPITIRGIETLLGLGAGASRALREREWSILDVGCGGGDTLRLLADWARKQGYRVKLTGADMQPDCLAYARHHSQGYAIDWLTSDYRELSGPYDLVITSLFCHHLDDAQMREFFAWTRRTARIGFVINDLQRHPFAYHAIHALTALLSKSAFVRYDGPMSVRRAFTHAELAALAASAGLHPRIRWQWAFRYLVAGYV